MNFSFRIARRYLFAKKSTNAINIISGISVFGISIGTAALVILLSVFNGFEELLMGMFNAFNPDVKVTPYEGKFFAPDSTQLAQLDQIPGILAVSKTLEEVAYFEYENNKDFGILKGVDENFLTVTRLDSMVREGQFILQQGNRDMAVLGLGMRNKLAVSAGDFSLIKVYMAKKNPGMSSRPFYNSLIYPAGTFVIQQDFDSQYVIASLDFVKRLMRAKNQISALEIKINAGADIDVVKNEISKVLGEAVKVQDRYQQDEAFLKLMNIEKWLFYALFCLAMILVAFNIVGALFMIVLDKQKDIGILKSMGATARSIRKIFINEGLLLCGLGLLIGFVAAIILYILQKTIVIVPIPMGFVVDAYPIEMKIWDFVVVGVTVMVIGWLASLPAANRAAKVSPIVRSE